MILLKKKSQIREEGFFNLDFKILCSDESNNTYFLLNPKFIVAFQLNNEISS